MEVLDDDLVLEDVNDVDIVPDALDRDLVSANLKAGDRPGHGRDQPVLGHERAAIVVVRGIPIDETAAAARVRTLHIAHRIGIDADEGALIVSEVVAENHGLPAANEDRRGHIRAAAGAIGRRRACGVVLDPAVGQPQIALMGLDHVEPVEGALDRRLAATVGDVGMIDAGLGPCIEHDPAPVARSPDIGQVAVGVERAARTEAAVAETREDDGTARSALGDQLARAALEFDPGGLKLHDHTGIGSQPPG